MLVEPQVVAPVSVVSSEIAFPLSADRKAAFFNALVSTGGHLGKACVIAKVSRQRVLIWRSTDADFAQAYDEAMEFGTENLEERLYQRGMDTDTTAAIFLLKARRPEKYREVYKVEQDQADPTQLAEALFAVMLAAAERLRAQAGPSQATEPQQLTIGPDGPTSK